MVWKGEGDVTYFAELRELNREENWLPECDMTSGSHVIPDFNGHTWTQTSLAAPAQLAMVTGVVWCCLCRGFSVEPPHSAQW